MLYSLLQLRGDSPALSQAFLFILRPACLHSAALYTRLSTMLWFRHGVVVQNYVPQWLCCPFRIWLPNMLGKPSCITMVLPVLMNVFLDSLVCQIQSFCISIFCLSPLCKYLYKIVELLPTRLCLPDDTVCPFLSDQMWSLPRGSRHTKSLL